VESAELAKLYTAPGPWMSIYLDRDPAVENAAAHLELRWRGLRTKLEKAGADRATLDAVQTAVLRAPETGASTQVIFASAGSVLYNRSLPEPIQRQIGWFGALPYVAPLLSWAQTRVPHLIVLADRTGADIMAYTDSPDPVYVDAVQGSHDELRKVGAGGWSHMRYQHRAEDSWEHNMAEAAEQAGRVADDIKAELILLNGDVRAVQLLREHLPGRLADRVKVIDAGGGRAVDGSDDVVAGEVIKRVAHAALARLTAVVDRFQEERGQRDRAADGPKATVEALGRAQVGTLLLYDDPSDERTAWFGPEATHIALDASTLKDLGVEPQQARLTDVLIRAAIGTGASVRIVPDTGPGSPTEGVGALLRYQLA